MNLHSRVRVFKQGLRELEEMVRQTERAVIGGGDAVSIIADNVNFFTKSFLISACAHLEVCIKEIVYDVANDIDSRLASVAVPASIIEWRFNQKKKNESAQTPAAFLAIKMTRKEVDDMVSGNVYKTKDTLALLGIELASQKDVWEEWKDSIQTIVTRRNNIVHHNDSASDISLGDIKGYIVLIVNYIDFIVDTCHMQCYGGRRDDDEDSA
jgi:RiboL-PSP-HEPN